MKPRKGSAANPGTVKKACACGSPISLSAAACVLCWATLTPSLQKRWRDAKYGEYSDAAMERAGAAIREFLRKEAAS